MSLNIYLAAPYAARDALRAYALELVRLGHRCTSSWLEETSDITPGTVGATTDLDDVACAKHVSKDIYDIRRSDALVVWTFDAACLLVPMKSNSGGRHVETGVALTLGRPVILIGQPENIFHRALPAADVVDDWHHACLRLAELDRAQPRDEVA